MTYCHITITHYIIHNVLHITSKVNVSAELVPSPPLVQCSRQVPHRRSQCWGPSPPITAQCRASRPISAQGAQLQPTTGQGFPVTDLLTENLLFIVITATKELREHRKFGLFPRHHGAVEGRGDIPQCSRLTRKAQ